MLRGSCPCYLQIVVVFLKSAVIISIYQFSPLSGIDLYRPECLTSSKCDLWVFLELCTIDFIPTRTSKQTKWVFFLYFHYRLTSAYNLQKIILMIRANIATARNERTFCLRLHFSSICLWPHHFSIFITLCHIFKWSSRPSLIKDWRGILTEYVIADVIFQHLTLSTSSILHSQVTGFFFMPSPKIRLFCWQFK